MTKIAALKFFFFFFFFLTLLIVLFFLDVDNSPEGVLWKSYYKTFCKVHRKTSTINIFFQVKGHNVTKKTLLKVFSSESCKLFQKTSSRELLPVAVSGSSEGVFRTL